MGSEATWDEDAARARLDAYTISLERPDSLECHRAYALLMLHAASDLQQALKALDMHRKQS